ncbi:hypothetical protein JTB14_013665 [Gonioctena quinquepunctata]|nr:hypothetical protein JTB14_013665 [Gonioctena quinquepunctata]
MTESEKEDRMSVDENENSSSSSSSDEEEENQELAARAQELEKQISSNEYLYDAHVEIVGLYRRTGDLNSMRAAYERFSEKFPLSPKLWLDWLKDEIKISSTLEEQKRLFGLFDKAVEDYLSVDLWVEYAQFSIGATDLNTTRSILERGLTSAGLHVSQGSLLWDTLRELEHAHVSIHPDNSEEWKNQVCKLADVFKRQLSVPLLNMENTYHEWKEWTKTLPEGLVDSKPLEWSYKKALQLLDTYKPFEERLLSAESTDLHDIYKEYIKAVKDPSTILCLYERAVTTLCLTPQLWEDYCKFAFQLGGVADKVSARALRNCTWSEDLWIARLRILEDQKKDESEVLACFEQGMSSVSTSLELWLSFIEYLHRNSKDDTKLDKLFVQASQQMAQGVDPTCKLNRLHARLLAKRGDMVAARKKWGEIIGQQHNKGSASVWLEYANLEKQYGDSGHLRGIYKKALAACKDWPQYIAEEWLMFERESGTLEDVMKCWEKCRSAISAEGPSLAQGSVEAPKREELQPERNRKRKFASNSNVGEERRAKQVKRFEEPVPTQPVVSKTIEKDPKTTIFVSNMHPSTDERCLKEIFPNAVQIEVAQDRKGKSRCFGYIRFSKEEEVMVALARDRLPIDGRPLFISEIKPDKAERKPVFKYANKPEDNKLFVKGLPLDKNIDEVKAVFEPYGPKDVRLVSKRNGQSKGIAFVEFETPEAAQKALKALDQTEIDGQTISVAVSAPPVKKVEEQPPVEEPIRHARSRLQIPMVPRSLQVKGANNSSGNGSSVGAPKSNADFRNMLLKK